MKKLLLLLSLLIISQSFSFAQSPININRSLGENMFYSGDRQLKQKEVLNILSVNDEAFREFKKARSNYIGAVILGCAGAAMIGWELGGLFAGADFNYVVAGVGAGLIVCCIPLISAYNKRSASAISIYNAGFSASYPSHRNGISLSMGLAPGGLGFCMMF